MTIELQKLILIMVRITSFIVFTPGFSFKGLPNYFKLALSMSFSLIIYFSIPDIAIISGLFEFSFYIVKEILLGLSLGYISKLIFGIIEIAGQLVDFQSGFSMASVYDPSAGSQISNYGKIYYWLSMSIFFILDIHHMLIESLVESFKNIPLTEISYTSLGVLEIIKLFSNVFALGFKLAVPIVVVVLVTDIVLAIISRTIPQINVLMLGMPLKSLMSFILTLLMMSWLLESIGKNIMLLPAYLNRFYNIVS